MDAIRCHAIACTEPSAPGHPMCYAHQRRFFIEQGNEEARIKLAEQQGEEDGRNGHESPRGGRGRARFNTQELIAWAIGQNRGAKTGRLEDPKWESSATR